VKALVVAGARPQFVKAAALLPALRRRGEALLVHTGQHTDAAMVQAHFPDLGLGEPDVHLEVTETNRGRRVAAMVQALVEVIEQQRPTHVLALGDTDSALAAGLGGALAGAVVAHVEAGARSGDRSMPEELNRITVDEWSRLLFCSTEAHAAELSGRDGVHVVGDVMADVLLRHEAAIRACVPAREAPYAVLTLHRAATADDAAALERVLQAVGRAGLPTLFPVHPRTRPNLPSVPANVELMEPLPYVQFLAHVAAAACVLTDSGGVQKEAYLLGVPCVTLRGCTEWAETVDQGWNVLVATNPERIAAALRDPPRGSERPPLYGDGNAASRIAAVLATD